VRHRGGGKPQESRQSREGQANLPVAQNSEVQRIVRLAARCVKDARGGWLRYRNLLCGARWRATAGEVPRPSAGGVKALEGEKPRRATAVDRQDHPAATRTDFQKEQSFEAGVHCTPATNPGTARSHAMPDSVGTRERNGETGVKGDEARLRERASGRAHQRKNSVGESLNEEALSRGTRPVTQPLATGRDGIRGMARRQPRA